MESLGQRLWAWTRGHLKAVLVAVGILAAAIAVLVVVLVVTSSGGGQTITPGTIVGRPQTSGYRVSGKVTRRTDASVTVLISAVDYSSGDARNTVLFPGNTIEFDRPAEGPTAVARNGHIVATPAALHVGDRLTLVGEFTSVVVPPGRAHDGYAYLGIEAESK